MRYPNQHNQFQQLTPQQQFQQQQQMQLQQMQQQQQMQQPMNPQFQQQQQFQQPQQMNPQNSMIQQQMFQQQQQQQQQALAMQLAQQRNAQQMQQPMYPNNQMHQGRYGNQSPNVHAGMSPGMFQSQSPEFSQTQHEDTGRFGGQVNQPVTQELVTEEPKLPVLTIDTGDFKFLDNSKIAIAVRSKEVIKETIVEKEELTVNLGMSYDTASLEEVLEGRNGKYISKGKVLIIDDTLSAESTDELEGLFNNDVKDLYRRIKRLINNTTSLKECVLLDRINTQVTEYINEYLLVTFGTCLSIESFAEDFNDLLKVLRNNYEEEEDLLLDYLDAVIKDINESMKTVSEEGLLDNNLFHVYRPDIVVYLEGYSHSTGLHFVKDMVELSSSENNLFIDSLIDTVYGSTGKATFLLITRDQYVFRLYVNNKGVKFVKRVQ